MWATSIGSTFSQSPVPGERKSGMPLGTEIPAPVSATVQREDRISSASRVTDAASGPTVMWASSVSSPGVSVECLGERTVAVLQHGRAMRNQHHLEREVE